jgi:ppGpp synthetase/RelA/SpoT-type nucleotidyltranferase
VARRSHLRLAGFVAVVAGGAAAALAFTVFDGPSSAKTLTPAEYVARVSAICQTYSRKLDRIPPPTDIASYGNVVESVKPALAILRQQAAQIRAIAPPPELRTRVTRFFQLTDRSIERLAAVLRAASRRDIAGLGIGLQRFDEATLVAKKASRRIGWHC